ncbi:MAG TPA: hypothetical protein VFA68_04600 [Terriglobales bacterium]|nr:hypothetical protein [Terriglobales bacterium]
MKTRTNWQTSARPHWHVFLILALVFSMSAYTATRFSNSTLLRAHGPHAPVNIQGTGWRPPVTVFAVLQAKMLLDASPFPVQPLPRSLDNRPPPFC